MFANGTEMTVEVHGQYVTQQELSQAVVRQFRRQGKPCEWLNSYTILLSGKVYTLRLSSLPTNKNFTQTVILTERA